MSERIVFKPINPTYAQKLYPALSLTALCLTALTRTLLNRITCTMFNPINPHYVQPH